MNAQSRGSIARIRSCDCKIGPHARVEEGKLTIYNLRCQSGIGFRNPSGFLLSSHMYGTFGYIWYLLPSSAGVPINSMSRQIVGSGCRYSRNSLYVSILFIFILF